MTAIALNNLLSFLQGTLSQTDRNWLAGKLTEPVTHETGKPQAKTKDKTEKKELSPKVKFLSNMHLREFTREELEADPLLAAITEDRRERR